MKTELSTKNIQNQINLLKNTTDALIIANVSVVFFMYAIP